MLCNDDRTHFRGLVNVLQTMFLYIANATNVFISSILDILRERGIPHQISPSTYHPWCYSVVSPVLRSSRLNEELKVSTFYGADFRHILKENFIYSRNYDVILIVDSQIRL